MKEHTLRVLTNSISKLATICLVIGIFSLGFSKTFFISPASFYFGKFNTFQDLQLTISSIFILLGSIFILTFKRPVLNKNYIYISLSLIIYGFLFKSFSILNIIIAFIFYITFQHIPKQNFDWIKKAIILGVIFQVTILLFQVIFQQSTTLNLLTYLGEPSLSLFNPNISQLHFDSFSFIRPYGTTYHPNFLAALILTAILTTSNKITQFLLFLFQIFTLSISNLISSIIYFTKKTSQYIQYSLYTIIIFGFLIKIYSLNYQGIEDRFFQIINLKNSISSFKISDLLFGHSNTLLTSNIYKQLPWEIQPLHNIFLETFYTYGLYGLTILTFTLKTFYKNSPQILIALLPIMLLDHFLITLPNGLLLFVVLLNIKKIRSS